MQLRSSQTYLQKTKKERDAFLIKFNPDAQLELCRDANDCFFGDYSSLAVIRKDFGDNAPTAWLIPQLLNLSEYCGCKDKLNAMQLKECASIIAREFYFLKVSEIMLFFYRFKSGRYGRFYGSIDPLVITSSLREFLKERSYSIEEHERKIKTAEMDLMKKDAITYEEYLSRKKENQLKI